MSGDDDLKPYRDILTINNGSLDDDVKTVMEGVNVKMDDVPALIMRLRHYLTYGRVSPRKRRAFDGAIKKLEQMVIDNDF